MANSKQKKKKALKGFPEDAIQAGAGLISQKMQYDYEKSLTKEERMLLHEERKRNGIILLVGLATIGVLGFTYHLATKQ